MRGQGKELRGFAVKPQDKLVGLLDRSLEWLSAPSEFEGELAKPGGAGIRDNWTGGKGTVDKVRHCVREVAEFSNLYALRPLHRITDEIARWIIDGFLPEWESQKRAGGLLDFDDLLAFARDLLMRSSPARRDFQDRFAALLVDEFQDTDPLQWQIVLLLSSASPDENDSALMPPTPGRLFLVGDPKQSIYRFRGADIETYLEIAKPQRSEALGLERIELTTNFRSVPSILRFVDGAFKDVMLPSE